MAVIFEEMNIEVAGEIIRSLALPTPKMSCFVAKPFSNGAGPRMGLAKRKDWAGLIKNHWSNWESNFSLKEVGAWR